MEPSNPNPAVPHGAAPTEKKVPGWLWFFAGGRGKPPTIAALQARKQRYQEQRYTGNFWTSERKGKPAGRPRTAASGPSGAKSSPNLAPEQMEPPNGGIPGGSKPQGSPKGSCDSKAAPGPGPISSGGAFPGSKGAPDLTPGNHAPYGGDQDKPPSRISRSGSHNSGRQTSQKAPDFQAAGSRHSSRGHQSAAFYLPSRTYRGDISKDGKEIGRRAQEFPAAHSTHRNRSKYSKTSEHSNPRRQVINANDHHVPQSTVKDAMKTLLSPKSHKTARKIPGDMNMEGKGAGGAGGSNPGHQVINSKDRYDPPSTKKTSQPSHSDNATRINHGNTNKDGRSGGGGGDLARQVIDSQNHYNPPSTKKTAQQPYSRKATRTHHASSGKDDKGDHASPDHQVIRTEDQYNPQSTKQTAQPAYSHKATPSKSESVSKDGRIGRGDPYRQVLRTQSHYNPPSTNKTAQQPPSHKASRTNHGGIGKNATSEHPNPDHQVIRTEDRYNPQTTHGDVSCKDFASRGATLKGFGRTGWGR